MIEPEPTANVGRKCQRCPSFVDPTKSSTRCSSCLAAAREDQASRRRLQRASMTATVVHPSFQETGVDIIAFEGNKTKKPATAFAASSVTTAVPSAIYSPSTSLTLLPPPVTLSRPMDTSVIDRLHISPTPLTANSGANFLSPTRRLLVRGINGGDTVSTVLQTSNPVLPTVGAASSAAHGMLEPLDIETLFEGLQAAGVIGCLLLAQDTPNGLEFHAYGNDLAQSALLPIFRKSVPNDPGVHIEDPLHGSETPSLTPSPNVENPFGSEACDSGDENIPDPGTEEYARLITQQRVSRTINGKKYTIDRHPNGKFVCPNCEKFSRRRGLRVTRHLDLCLKKCETQGTLPLTTITNIPAPGLDVPRKRVRPSKDEGKENMHTLRPRSKRAKLIIAGESVKNKWLGPVPSAPVRPQPRSTPGTVDV
ncbi:hypothetical protein C8R43DRAFT_1022527, partial [Mycena crocata]